MILPIDGAPLDPAAVGGKAWGLSRLVALGFPVPPAFVVTVEAGGVLGEGRALLEGLGEPLAVRSSAVGEDAADRSAAGQYESVMGVRRGELAEAVRRVHGSGASARVAAYGGGTAMAVVVQREVAATRAGVAFSRDPVDGSDAVALECVFGHGERLVSGQVTPDRYRVGPDETVRARVAPRAGATGTVRTLRDDEALAVAALVREAEAGFGHPVDVEFCFDGAGDLWLLQCRAVTALATPA